MAKKQAARVAPIDIDVESAQASQDQQLVSTDSASLRSFLGGLTAFFTKAGELERAAKERLDMARQLKAPTDAASDEKIQHFIRDAKAEIKVVEDHWTITAVVHTLHRKLTAARNRVTSKDAKGLPVGMLDEAAAIAQKLHNRYVEDEQRRAKQEEDRLREEAEARARQDRENELARLEAQALALESTNPDLSERETTFTSRVAAGSNASDAARIAGYKDPDTQAVRLLKTPKIVSAIEGLRAAANLRKQATATKAMPVQVETTTVRPNITKAAGATDRTTHGAEVFDTDALIVAVLDPMMRTRLGIPADIVSINESKVNEYGGSLKELINTWPGVRHTKKTSTF
jgi:hypothetical protein